MDYKNTATDGIFERYFRNWRNLGRLSTCSPQFLSF